MSRTTRANRKVREAQQRSKTYSAAGPTLLSQLEGFLYESINKYLNLKQLNPWEIENLDNKILIVRGEIRGLARAIAKIRLPYEDQTKVVKQIEREFTREAKES